MITFATIYMNDFLIFQPKFKKIPMKKMFTVCAMAACLLCAQSVNAQDVVTGQDVSQMSAKELKAAAKVQKEKENSIKDAQKAKIAAEKAHKKAESLAKKAEDAQKAAKKADEKAQKAQEKAERLNGGVIPSTK